MRVIEQSAEIQDWRTLDLYERVETAARVCRRSKSKEDAEGFVRSLIKRGHFSPLEFARIVTGVLDCRNVRRIRETAEHSTNSAVWVSRLMATYPALVEDLHYAPESGEIVPDDNWIPVLFTTSRTISHQLVRYRHDITFCQESQRHVRYNPNKLEIISPIALNNEQEKLWYYACNRAEITYSQMMEHGCTAEQARAVLPGCTATRILAYASPSEWRHIFSQRCDKHADPQMRALMAPLQARMLELRLI